MIENRTAGTSESGNISATIVWLIPSGEFDVHADDGRDTGEDADRNEKGGKHQRSNPRTIPKIKHGPATTTIATIPIVVNEPCVTSDSSGASTATSEGRAIAFVWEKRAIRSISRKHGNCGYAVNQTAR